MLTLTTWGGGGGLGGLLSVLCHRNHYITKPVFESMLQEALLSISKQQQ